MPATSIFFGWWRGTWTTFLGRPIRPVPSRGRAYHPDLAAIAHLCESPECVIYRAFAASKPIPFDHRISNSSIGSPRAFEL